MGASGEVGDVASDTFHGERWWRAQALSRVKGDQVAPGARSVEQTTDNRAVGSPSARAPRACARPGGRGRWGQAEAAGLSFAALKQRQLVFLLTRQVVEAQFVRADQERTERLWQEAAALDLDPDRIIHLLYGVADHADSAEMDAVDRSWRPGAPPPRRSWWAPGLGRLMGKGAGVWHQNVPAAGIPACP